MNRVRAGWCAVPNPFNSKQVSRVELNPRDTIFVFWTRWARPFLKHLEELQQLEFPAFGGGGRRGRVRFRGVCPDPRKSQRNPRAQVPGPSQGLGTGKLQSQKTRPPSLSRK